jgi:glycosyltransferase involved in cell wall biosynthesis
VFAGTWRKNKGIEDLIPAFERLARTHAGLSLTVLGAGIERQDVLHEFAADLRDRVTVMASVDDELAARTLASSDVFVLPSLFEGTPLTLIEAMMSALPIVTTDTCGMRDTLINETTGLLVPIRSPDAIVAAVTRLVDDAPLRARLGRAAQTAALHRHTWRAVAGDVLDAYTALAARSAA